MKVEPAYDQKCHDIKYFQDNRSDSYVRIFIAQHEKYKPHEIDQKSGKIQKGYYP